MRQKDFSQFLQINEQKIILQEGLGKMRNKFDMQLEKLSEQLIYMGSLCEKAIGNATKALQSGDLELAKRVIHEDEEIDQKEKDIERMCLKLLLQQQPVARDLRQISAALKMITDLERIGDQAADIAEILISAGIPEVREKELIGKMAESVCRMMHDSILAYVTKDLELSRKVMLADDEVDGMFDQVKHNLAKIIAENHGNQGEKAIDLIMISKYLERVGDHTTNIAEWVEFSITGVHKGADNV